MTRRYKYSLIVLCVGIFLHAVAQKSMAGISLHYEGRLKSEGDMALLIEKAKAYANKNGWKWEEVRQTEGKRFIYINEEEIEYLGPLNGIVLYPHDMSEPLNIIFDRDLFMQDSTKTQFAGADTHVAIVKLLKSMEQHYAKFSVIDESEYWDRQDYELLVNHISTVNKMIKNIKTKNPSVRGPVKLKNGLIVDVME